MKTILSINECSFGSTGKIAKSILSFARQNGYKTYFACHSLENTNGIDYQISGNKFFYFVSKLRSKIDGSDGFNNITQTKRFLKWVNSIKPDIIHLHNLHSHYINLKDLLEYSFAHDIKIVWTMHDCWPFTGKCTHFDFVGCDKWKNECGHCPQLKIYPQAYLLDKTNKFLCCKKGIINKIKENVTIVSPSFWMDSLVSNSILAGCSHEIIHNGINLDDNQLKAPDNDIVIKMKQYKKIFFSASYPFSKRKGIDFIFQLALKRNKYLFIIAGLDKKQTKNLPENVISLGRIKDNAIMNWLYSNSTAFVNTTLEETFSIVNIESMFNGTPVISFNSGGACESLVDTPSFIINKGDLDGLVNAIDSVEKNSEVSMRCRERAAKYDIFLMCKRYLMLFEELVK